MRKPRGLLVAALVIALASVLVIPGGAARAATQTSAQSAVAIPSVYLKPFKESPGAVDPECILYFMNQQGNPGGVAHISSFLYHKHNIRAVKINAKVQCRRVSMDLLVQVTLWKTGLISPHKQAGPTTATAAKGNQLKNQMTWRECANTKKSTFYGTAYASVVFQGVKYSESLQSQNATLDCGT
jgi:hypothetical protein